METLSQALLHGDVVAAPEALSVWKAPQPTGRTTEGPPGMDQDRLFSMLLMANTGFIINSYKLMKTTNILIYVVK